MYFVTYRSALIILPLLSALLPGTVVAQEVKAANKKPVAEAGMELMYRCWPKDGRPYWRNRKCAEAPEDLIQVDTALAPSNLELHEQLQYIHEQRAKQKSGTR